MARRELPPVAARAGFTPPIAVTGPAAAALAGDPERANDPAARLAAYRDDAHAAADTGAAAALDAQLATDAAHEATRAAGRRKVLRELDQASGRAAHADRRAAAAHRIWLDAYAAAQAAGVEELDLALQRRRRYPHGPAGPATAGAPPG